MRPWLTGIVKTYEVVRTEDAQRFLRTCLYFRWLSEELRIIFNKSASLSAPQGSSQSRSTVWIGLKNRLVMSKIALKVTGFLRRLQRPLFLFIIGNMKLYFLLLSLANGTVLSATQSRQF